MQKSGMFENVISILIKNITMQGFFWQDYIHERRVNKTETALGLLRPF